MKYKIIIMMLFVVALLGLVQGAVEEDIITVRQGSTINILQSCATSTYSNITSAFINGVSNKIITTATPMQEIVEDTYNYTWTNTSTIGRYYFYGFCDEKGTKTNWGLAYDVTQTGDSYNESQLGVIVAQLGLIALFVTIAFAFGKEKWKLRGAFFIFALFMGIIMLNSLRVITGSSNVLGVMGTTGIILGIVALSFMILYLLIYYTVEVIQHFKFKKENKWKS